MKEEGLWIQASQLYFTSEQLEQLNVYFSDMETCQDLKQNQTINWLEGEIEKLIQYLCCVVGNIDSRFSSEFLIRLQPTKVFFKNSNCFSYLIRLDNLSTPSSYFNRNDVIDFGLIFDTDKIPDGFAKIKFENEDSIKKWNDCTTTTGYLRRDKVQKKYIELLEKATSAKIGNVKKIIEKYESYHSPGKIVDVETLHHILNIPPQERIFYGSSEDTKYFDSSDVKKFRIEVIESNHLIRLRIGFLSPNVILDEDIDVILILGIGLQGWPSSSDYPHRIPFTNCDILLHQQMATMGFFLMTACPQPLANKNRSTLWQFSFPTVECMLTNHYSELSCVNRTINILYSIMLNLRRTTAGGHTVGKYIIKNLLWFQLEKLNQLKHWISDNLSYHVLSILDILVQYLRKQKLRSYFFENDNVFSNSFRNIFACHSADDFKEDADVIETFINRIHVLSSSELIGQQILIGERRLNNSFVYESVLIRKWNLLINMMNSRKRDEKLIQFNSKQIEYITFLFQAVLITKSVIIPLDNRQIRNTRSMVDYSAQMLNRKTNHNSVISFEDVSYLVPLFFEQAKRFYLTNEKSKKNHLKFFTRDQKVEDVHYNEGVKLALQRLRENPVRVFSSDFEAVKFVFEILHVGCLTSKTLRRILKSYLKSFLTSIHENCWYLEEWKNRLHNDELAALMIFSRLVSERRIKFKIGLLDALQKGWDWAYEMVKLCINLKKGQNLLFTLPNGQITRRYLILSDEEIEKFEKYQLNVVKRGYRNVINKLHDTLKIEDKLEYSGEDTSVHCKLRDCSPITRVINSNRRRGMHLGLGNIIFSLVMLGKFTTLQEITQVLPEERRHQVLETIQRARNEKQRADREIRKSGNHKEIYRFIPESYYSLSSHPEDETSYAKNGNIISLFEDSQSSAGTSSATCSSSFDDRRRQDSAYVLYNNSVFDNSLVTYSQHENNKNWRSPTSFLM